MTKKDNIVYFESAKIKHNKSDEAFFTEVNSFQDYFGELNEVLEKDSSINSVPHYNFFHNNNIFTEVTLSDFEDFKKNTETVDKLEGDTCKNNDNIAFEFSMKVPKVIK